MSLPRSAQHDVSAVVEVQPGADSRVLALSRSESRVLLTEDKDFGVLAYAGGHETAGVILIRFPGDARVALAAAVANAVNAFGEQLATAFVVVEPGRARLSRTRTKT